MPFRGVRVFLNSMIPVAKTAREFMEKNSIRSAVLLDLKGQQEPVQTATVEANIIAAAYSGREACMDFYHSSSFAIHGFGISGKFFAEPTVRVTLTLPLMMGIHDWLMKRKSEMPADELEGKI